MMTKEEMFISALEAVIDSRFKYLKELEYENRCYAVDFKKEYYEPAVKILLEVLKKEFDNSAE